MLSPAALITVCFGGLVCLAPVAFYLCWLAAVNRRGRPTVVNGAWDFAGLLASLTGFLLVGGVLVRGMVMSNPWVVGRDFHDMGAVFDRQWVAWLALVFGYLLLLGVMVRVAVHARVTTLAVYHVEPEAADAAVDAALESAGLVAVRRGHLWEDDRRLVEVVPFPGTRHATVRVLCPDRRLREEIERHLRDQLARVSSPESSAGVWFSTLAGGAVMVVVGLVALAAYTLFFRL